MEDHLSAQAASRRTLDYEAELDRLLAEMSRMNDQMAEDRVAIERLKRESEIIWNQTRVILERIAPRAR